MSETDSLCNEVSKVREPGKQERLRSGRKEGEKQTKPKRARTKQKQSVRRPRRECISFSDF